MFDAVIEKEDAEALVKKVEEVFGMACEITNDGGYFDSWVFDIRSKDRKFTVFLPGQWCDKFTIVSHLKNGEAVQFKVHIPSNKELLNILGSEGCADAFNKAFQLAVRKNKITTPTYERHSSKISLWFKEHEADIIFIDYTEIRRSPEKRIEHHIQDRIYLKPREGKYQPRNFPCTLQKFNEFMQSRTSDTWKDFFIGVDILTANNKEFVGRKSNFTVEYPWQEYWAPETCSFDFGDLEFEKVLGVDYFTHLCNFIVGRFGTNAPRQLYFLEIHYLNSSGEDRDENVIKVIREAKERARAL